MRKKILLFVLLMLIGNRAWAEQTPWTVINKKTVVRGEWVIRWPVVVNESGKLAIKAGSRIRFELSPDPKGRDVAGITIHGILEIQGTEDQPVTLAMDKPFPEFAAIKIESESQSKILFARFTAVNFGLHIHFSPVLVESCRFEKNQAAVKLRSGRVILQDNLFTGNHTAIRFWYGDPVIVGNRFIDNQTGIFVRGGVKKPIIAGNSFNNRKYDIKLSESQNHDLKAINNRWRSNDSDIIRNYIYDRRKSDYLGLVEIKPVINE
ncbi:MAG: right-handed parallel beta-helix repeat-containing protein [bacterium]